MYGIHIEWAGDLGCMHQSTGGRSLDQNRDGIVTPVPGTPLLAFSVQRPDSRRVLVTSHKSQLEGGQAAAPAGTQESPHFHITISSNPLCCQQNLLAESVENLTIAE